MGLSPSSTRFLCMSGHKARTCQDCSGASGKGRGVDARSGVGFWSGAGGCLVGPVRTKGVKNGKISDWRGLSLLDAIDCSDADIEVACYRAD